MTVHRGKSPGTAFTNKMLQYVSLFTITETRLRKFTISQVGEIPSSRNLLRPRTEFTALRLFQLVYRSLALWDEDA